MMRAKWKYETRIIALIQTDIQMGAKLSAKQERERERLAVQKPQEGKKTTLQRLLKLKNWASKGIFQQTMPSLSHGKKKLFR